MLPSSVIHVAHKLFKHPIIINNYTKSIIKMPSKVTQGKCMFVDVHVYL